MNPRRKVTLKRQKETLDWPLGLVVVLLVLFGLLMVYDASVAEAHYRFADKFFYIRQQIRWVVLGALAAILATKIDYRFFRRLALPALLMVIALLIFVLLPTVGTKALGARRWLSLAGFTLQPAELAKPVLILYLASWLTQRRPFWAFLFLIFFIAGLIALEPDLGTAVIVTATGFLLYFIAGAPLFHLAALGGLGSLGGLALIWFSEYRRQRLLVFLRRSFDPQGASYHIRQVLLALGSGGLWGLGLGQSRQKYEYLPAAATDSIFAVIGEEFGFLGGASVILAFLFLVWRGVRIAKNAPDSFGRLLATGITAWIGLQALVNLAAMVALIPLTGVPLPFISYGGSSMVTSLAGIGILLNISQHQVGRR